MLSYKPYQKIRICGGKEYWFNKIGILESGSRSGQWITSQDLREAFDYDEIKVYVHDSRNVFSMLRLCISKLSVGDSIDTLESLIKSHTAWMPFPNELDRFITKIEKPNYERLPDNKNKRTFDFIRVDVNVLTNISERNQYIHNHYNEICNMVLQKIESSNRFKKFGIPVNFLRLEKATFIPRISVIEFLFGLEEIENII